MRAAVLNNYSEAPRAGEFDDPGTNGDGGVVVDVLVAGLNPVDLYTAAGQLPDKPPLPSVVGLEGIAGFQGRNVYFDQPVRPFGSMGERALVDPASLVDVPPGVDPELAVSFGVAGLAAWLSLEWRARLQPKEAVLVLGASGVVGQIAVQAARLLGAGRVVAAARDQESLERAKSEYGADAVVDLGDEDGLTERFVEAAEGEFDVVVDPLWGAPAIAAIGALAEGGRLAQIGNSAGQTAEVPARLVRTKIRSIIGHTNFSAPQEIKASAFTRMCEHAAQGRLRVPVKALSLDEVDRAWSLQQEGTHRKLVITTS
jgi:NADPH:quinone reductase-like Zn-dependent oxidoreductase